MTTDPRVEAIWERLAMYQAGGFRMKALDGWTLIDDLAYLLAQLAASEERWEKFWARAEYAANWNYKRIHEEMSALEREE